MKECWTSLHKTIREINLVFKGLTGDGIRGNYNRLLVVLLDIGAVFAKVTAAPAITSERDDFFSRLGCIPVIAGISGGGGGCRYCHGSLPLSSVPINGVEGMCI